MTKDEFDQKFNSVYHDVLMHSYNPDAVKKRLSESANENGKISSEDLYCEFLLLSAEFSKDLIYATLTNILEFSDSKIL